MSLTFPSPSQPSVSYVYRGFLLQVPVPLPHGSISVEYQVATATDDSVYTPYWTVAIVDATTNFAYIFSGTIASIFYQFRYRYKNFDGTTSDWSDYVAAGNGTQTSNWSVDQTAASIGTITSGFIRGVIFETNANYPKVRMDPSGFYAVDGLSTPVMIPSDPSTPITFQGKIIASSLSIVPINVLLGSTPAGNILTNASVTAPFINVGELSAISANLGSITAGTITGGTFESTPTGGGAVRFNSTGFFVTDISGSKSLNLTSSTGLSFMAASSGVSPIREISWFHTNGQLGGEIYFQDTPIGSISRLVLNAIGVSTNNVEARLIANDNTAAAKADIGAYSGTTDASNLIKIITDTAAGGSTSTRTILDGLGQSNFVQTFDASTGTIAPATPIPTFIQPTNASFSNSYINYQNSFRYWRDGMGTVHVVGEINNGTLTANTLVYTFNAGYRPINRYYFPVVSNSATGVLNRFLINASGELRVDDSSANANAYSNFGHITFPTF